MYVEHAWPIVHLEGNILELYHWIDIFLTNNFSLQTNNELAEIHLSYRLYFPLPSCLRVSDPSFTDLMQIVYFHYHLSLIEKEFRFDCVPWIRVPWREFLCEFCNLSIDWIGDEVIFVLIPLNMIEDDWEILINYLF